MCCEIKRTLCAIFFWKKRFLVGNDIHPRRQARQSKSHENGSGPGPELDNENGCGDETSEAAEEENGHS